MARVRRRVESRAGEVLRLLDQRDQRRRIAGDSGDLQLVAGQAQLGDIGMVGQHPAQRLQHDHARRRLVFAPLQRRDGERSPPSAPARIARAPCRDLPRHVLFLPAEAAGDIGGGAGRQHRHHGGNAEHRLQTPAELRRIEMAARALLEHLDAAGLAARRRSGSRSPTDGTRTPPGRNSVATLRVVAAIMVLMVSLPAGTGAVQPNTASPAPHGVRRSICARTMPSRKSAARAGSSSGRNRKRFGCSTISTRLPRNSGPRSGADSAPSA